MFRVLVVDDSPVMRRFVRRTLELSGFPVGGVLEAGDGRQALEMLRTGAVDVILTDLNMPVMDGEQFLAELARDPNWNTVPVVVVSTDGTEDRLKHMLGLGARGYVKKPFLPEALREALEKVLEGRNAVS
jgi:two-component system chemotaxis response regulator CheY